MNITGTTTLTADRATVWKALNDPAVLVATIPGCRRLEAVGEDTYRMTVSAGVGSVQGVYDGEVRLSDHEEPSSFRMHAQGSGAPGTIGADVSVRLEDAPERGTVLSYDAEAIVGGMIGGVGQRMLTGASKKMADEFFRNVDAVLLAGTGPAAGDAQAARPGAPPPASAVSPGTVFTAPPAARRAGPGFAAGVAVGAAAALLGALVGGWIAGRGR
jgi:carbon monoxide dehydrogenase subunit G